MKLFTAIFCLFVITYVLVPAEKQSNSEGIKKRLNEIDTEIKKIDKQKDSILNQIYKIELSYEKELIKYNKLNTDIRITEKRISTLLRERNALRLDIEKSKKKIAKILRVLYKQGANRHLKVFVNTKDINQIFRNYKLFASLLDFNNEEIIQFKVKIENLVKLTGELETQRQTQVEMQAKVQKRLRVLRGIKSNKLGLMRQISNEKEKFFKLRSELENEALKFTDTVIKKIESVPAMNAVELGQIKGKLDWPVKGKVISKFGKQRSGKFNTYVINNGIEIKPKNNRKKIRSIYSGSVVYSDYWKGYGKLIVVRHSAKFLSFYGHCKRFLKRKGEYVRTGEEIAIIGDTGSTKSDSLYFEIRMERNAEDPLTWLKK